MFHSLPSLTPSIYRMNELSPPIGNLFFLLFFLIAWRRNLCYTLLQ